MMDWYSLEKFADQRTQERLQEVRMLRLARDIQASKPNPAGRYDQALAYLGGRLVSMGKNLQQRHGECCVEVANAAAAMRATSSIQAAHIER